MLRTEEKCWRWPSWLLFALAVTAFSASVNAASSAAVENTHRPSGRADEHGFEPPDHEADSSHHILDYYPVASVDFKRVQIPFIIALWIFLATLAKIGFHMANKLSSIFPESCLLIVVGVVIGLLLFYTQLTTVSPLTPDTFFLYMLPPIVLDAGYFMPNRLFFDNLGSILLFAVIGTIWNTVTIGLSLYAVGLTGLYSVELKILDAFLFSALISAVDPVAVLAVFEEIQVNEVLYIVVFGESLLNDAVTVVLYHMFQAYTEMVEVNGIKYTDYLSGFASFFVVALGGTAIGVVWGYMTAFVTRFTNHVRVIEPILVFVMSYMSYLNAEMFKLSGILAITFCGISMKNYVEANISHKSHTTVKYTMKMIASSSETIIFMFLGVSTVTDDHDWNTWFVIFTILFCTVYRAIGVVILTTFANHFRVQKLNKVEEFVMAYGGLRGAVAFALVLTINVNAAHRHMFITTTIAVVYFTVFVQGITIKPLVDILGVKKSEKRKVTMNERIHERFMDHLMAGIEDIVGHHGNHHLRDKFKYYDNNFIRRWFVRDHKTNDPKILETFSKLNIKDAMNMVHSSNNALPRVGTTEFSFSNLFANYTQSNLSQRDYDDKSTSKFLTVPMEYSQGSFSPELSGATWDRDLKELNYLPAGRDINEANLHHILSDAMFKPPRRSRKYSRSQIHEPEVNPQFHHKMRMQIRHVLSEQSKHRKMKERKKNGATGSGGKTPVLNGAASIPTYTITAYPEDEDAIMFAAQPGHEDDDVFSLDPSSCIGFFNPLSVPMRLRPHHLPITGTGFVPHPISFAVFPDHSYTRFSESDLRQAPAPRSRPPSPPPPQTLTEAQLPWKRDADDTVDEAEPVRQQEFPSWIDNKEYTAYMSPSSSFQDGFDGLPTRTPLFDMFERLEEEEPEEEEPEDTVIEVDDHIQFTKETKDTKDTKL